MTNVLTFFSFFYLILYYIWDTISQRSYAILKLKFKSYLFYEYRFKKMLGILIQSFQNTNENQRAFAKSLIYLKRNIHFELLPVMFKKK